MKLQFMIETKQIQVFLSCPDDVAEEKAIAKELCRTITERLSQKDCAVSFVAKDWRDVIGPAGINPQEYINIVFGVYDVYIGIWWMHFGTKTGITNPSTGKEYESGTHQEFEEAQAKFIAKSTPTLYLFFKKPTIAPTEQEKLRQYSLVVDFRAGLKNSKHWINQFEKKKHFRSEITHLLYGLAFDLCRSSGVKEKKKFLDDANSSLRGLYKKLFDPFKSIVPRTITHFLDIKEREELFFKPTRHLLESVIQEKKRIVLLGDAGSGKSTLLKNLAHALDSETSQYIPVFCHLNTYTTETKLEDFLSESWPNIPKELAVVIIDGLDEIQPQHFNSVVRKIIAFSDKYPETRMVVSCRSNFYELPLQGTAGTLSGFDPYFITDFNSSDVKAYLESKGLIKDVDAFIQSVHDNHLEDIFKKPFFLMLLANVYAEQTNLSISRSKLYELYIESRINLDKTHFKTTRDITSSEEVLKLLEKVALSMEILAKNFITEKELSQIISIEQNNTIKYCSAFKKSERDNQTWQFEHNNIQEYLAARGLANLSFTKIKQFITFKPSHKKLIPSWINTLTFLFSILEVDDGKFKKLIKWMLDNEKEVIVKMEREQVPVIVREKIFIQIFNLYKKRNIAIHSNLYNYSSLAHFAQSDKSIAFLLKELETQKNKEIVKLNAIRLLEHFQYNNPDLKIKLENRIIEEIKLNIKIPYYVSSCVYALKRAHIWNEDTVDVVFHLLKDQANQSVRAAMYWYLREAGYVEKYIDYLIEGLEIRKKGGVDRENFSLFDETWHLTNLLKEIKSPPGIKKIFTHFANSLNVDLGYDTAESIVQITQNAASAYSQDKTVYEPVLDWFVKAAMEFRRENANTALKFFDETNTRSQAFDDVIKKFEDEKNSRYLPAALLADPLLLQSFISKYLAKEILEDDVKEFRVNIMIYNNSLFSELERLLSEQTDIPRLHAEPPIDYEKIRKEKQRQDYDLLFQATALKNKTLEVFDSEAKSEFTSDELYQLRREHGRTTELEDIYPGISIRILKEFSRENRSVKRAQVEAWFNKPAHVESYCVGLIYQNLVNHDEILSNVEQIQWIIGWCKKTLPKIDFSKAITKTGENSKSFNTYAIYLAFFIRKFDIDVGNSKLLEMLLFDYYEKNEWVGVNWIFEKVPESLVAPRIKLNIEAGIEDEQVLKNHFDYVFSHGLKTLYPHLLNEVINISRSYYVKRELLKMYWTHTNNTEELKNLIAKADIPIRWQIVDLLIQNGNTSDLIKSLVVILSDKNEAQEEQLKAAENLVKLESIKGLEYYVGYIGSATGKNLRFISLNCLYSLKDIKSLPYLMKLLLLSYEKELVTDEMDRFNHVIAGALNNLSLVSDANFSKVKSSLKTFIRKYGKRFSSVNYLHNTIDKMESQFYFNKAQSHTIRDVKDKIKLLK